MAMVVPKEEFKIPLSVLQNHIIPREPVFVDLVEKTYVDTLMSQSRSLVDTLNTIATGNLLSILQIKTLANNASATFNSLFPAN